MLLKRTSDKPDKSTRDQAKLYLPSADTSEIVSNRGTRTYTVVSLETRLITYTVLMYLHITGLPFAVKGRSDRDVQHFDRSFVPNLNELILIDDICFLRLVFFSFQDCFLQIGDLLIDITHMLLISASISQPAYKRRIWVFEWGVFFFAGYLPRRDKHEPQDGILSFFLFHDVLKGVDMERNRKAINGQKKTALADLDNNLELCQSVSSQCQLGLSSIRSRYQFCLLSSWPPHSANHAPFGNFRSVSTA